MKTETKQQRRPSQAGGKRGMKANPRTRYPLLLLLGLVAFGATFAVVRYVNRSSPAPDGAPPGMVWIPGGEFTMGTDSDPGWADEKPAHRVRVDGFWMDQTDVTNA